MRFPFKKFLTLFLIGFNINLFAQNIFTIAGGGTDAGDEGPTVDALIDTPQEVVLDPAGNIIIVDSDKNRIRQIGDIVLSVFDN